MHVILLKGDTRHGARMFPESLYRSREALRLEWVAISFSNAGK